MLKNLKIIENFPWAKQLKLSQDWVRQRLLQTWLSPMNSVGILPITISPSLPPLQVLPPEVKQVLPSFFFPGHLCLFAPKCFTLLQQNIFLFCKNCNIFWSTCNFIAKSWKSSINMQILRHVYCMSKAKLLHCIHPSNTIRIFLYISCPFKLFLSVFCCCCYRSFSFKEGEKW